MIAMTILKWFNNPKENINTRTIQHLWAETQLIRLDVLSCMVCLGQHSYDNALGYLEYLVNMSDDYLEDTVLFKRITSPFAEVLEKLICDNLLAVEDMALQLGLSYARSMYTVINYIHIIITASMPTVLDNLKIKLPRNKAYRAIGIEVIKYHLLSVEDIVAYFK